MQRLDEPLPFHWNCDVYAIREAVHHSTLDLPWSTEGWLKMLGSRIVLMMTPKSTRSRQRSKSPNPTGMHQSAQSIKDSFHEQCTPLLTLCLAVRADLSASCQQLSVWLMWATQPCLMPSMKVTLRMCCTWWRQLMLHICRDFVYFYFVFNKL